MVAHNCRYCFIPGTQVLTDKGHVGIEELFRHGEATSNPEVRVVKGVKAMSHQGRWRLVQKAFEHLYSGPVVKLRPFYLPGFECTPDHAVFAAIGGGTVKKMKAGSLRLGDYLAVPLAKPSSDEPVDVRRFSATNPRRGTSTTSGWKLFTGGFGEPQSEGLAFPRSSTSRLVLPGCSVTTVRKARSPEPQTDPTVDPSGSVSARTKNLESAKWRRSWEMSSASGLGAAARKIAPR